ncbi:MAG: DNA helicase UvrD [Desulfatitalea sp. BRH_c12]|nr:MAG: DNA helicase UvrD [Desulfatitalea sp. BRH_c12]
MDLTKQQNEAVRHMGSPALVIAGAGSGKTRTLTAKISYLIDKGFDPERILAITFTNKAADEMKSRLVRITGLARTRFPWVRTYHSACLQILKAHYALLGFSATPQIYQPHQQEKIVKEILIQHNFDKKHTRPVLYQISLAKNSADPYGYFRLNPTCAFLIDMAEIYTRYETILKERTAVDFDNILLLTRDLLRDQKAVREAYKERFAFVLVDEYQDTNDLQEQLTGLLTANGNLFCVGDDWQAIYSFRGSNVNHFLAFEKSYPGAKLFRLEQNFRSVDEIVQVANRVIAQNETRMDKTCFSNKKGGVVELHSFPNEGDEARWVASKVGVLHRSGIPYDKLAVLYRTKFCSLSFEQTFRAAHIPYKMMGGKGFFERKEIMDLVSYLSLAQFEKDDVSLERVINTPKRGVGPGTLKKFAALRMDGMSLLDALRLAISNKILSAKLYDGLKAFVTLIDDIKCMTPDQAIRETIVRTRYMEHLQEYAKGDSRDITARQENIDQLIYSASQKATLQDFLEEATLFREDKEEEPEEDTGGVRLSTIHASKGLEYHTVFVIGCEEKLFPHWKSMDYTADMEEERRLMYVSMTRAERCLYLSSVSFRRGQYNPPSRFLGEIEGYLQQ